MIVRPKDNWWRLLFVWRGSMLRSILPQLVIVLLLSTLAVWTEGKIFAHKVPLNATPFSLVGVALALFLGFRNSSAYDRWWEGRRLWGSVVNATRTLTREALTLTSLTRPPAEGHVEMPSTREFVDMLIAFTYAMRDQLRGDRFARMELLSPALAAEVGRARYQPLMVLRGLSEWVAARHRAGAMTDTTLASFDANLRELEQALGGCERIASTPVPFSYSVMIHRVVYLYCALLPFGLVDGIEWMTPVVSLLMAYAFIALDSLAAELEMPFNRTPNDLALDAISRNVELSLRELSGEALELEPLRPVDYILH